MSRDGPPVDPLIGQTIGAYRVTGVLGLGGMAVVFRAQHEAIGRQMAVKVLKHEVAADSDWARRFVAEAQVVASLKHRNIVEVFDFGQLPDGRQYLMMELVEGQPLDQYIVEHAPLPTATALEFADQLLNGLGEAHKKGVVHRDLKPGNVVVVREHNNELLLKVLDFGLARTGARAALTEAGEGSSEGASLMAGTPAYIAPEQARGLIVDGRADLYALGVMLFEMLSGQLPFTADSDRALVEAQVWQQAPVLGSLMQVSPEIEAFVASMLAKSPEDRPETADVARRQVHRLILQVRSESTVVRRKGQLEKPAPPTPHEKAEPRSIAPRRRWAWPIVAGAGVGFAILGVLATALPPPPATLPEVRIPTLVRQRVPEPNLVPREVKLPLAVEEAVPPPPGQLNAPVKPTTARPHITPKPTTAAPCQFDDRLRDYARRTRDELKALPAAANPAFAAASETLGNALAAKDCAKVNQALIKLQTAAKTEDE
jgi:serine/threonine protein kinase